MQFWVVLLAGLTGGALLGRWYFLRRTDWRIKLLSYRLNRIAGRKNPVKISSLMKGIYRCIHDCMRQNNQTAAYQAIDLLKLALGERLGRGNESMRLMALAVAALRTKQPDIAGYVLDAYTPLVRGLNDKDRIAVIEQLTLIAMVALKARYNFMLAKVVNKIFAILEQMDKAEEPPIISAGLRGLKSVGMMAVRRKDEALFREISLRIGNLNYYDEETAKEVIGVLNEWLHRIIKNENQVMFDIVLQFCWQYMDKDHVSNQICELLVYEWQNLSGMAALNPNSQMAAEMIEFLFSLAEKRSNEQLWTLIIAIAAKTARLAFAQHGINVGFVTMYPLLDHGRRLLAAELKFHQISNDGLRQKVLFLIIRECVTLAALIARKDMTSSTGEVLAQLYQKWVSYPEMRGTLKSVKKFCQILILYWMKNRQRQSRRSLSGHCDIVEPSLLSDSEKERLGLS